MTIALDTIAVTVEVPANVAGRDVDALAARIRLLLVLDAVRAGQLTRVSAAHALEMPLDAFLKVADEHGLYAFDYDPDDFERELVSIDKIERRVPR